MSQTVAEVIILPISMTLKNQRLDIGLTVAGVVASRAQAQKWIADGLVTINGNVPKPSYRLQESDHLEVTIEKRQPSALVPYDFPLDIVFEDDDLLIVNKPSGLVVHPACGHTSDTLVNALIAHNKKLSKGSEDFRPGLVHRIDKDTSGLLVIAKNEFSHSYLAKLFLQKNIHRRYEAIVFGCPKQKSGILDSYLQRDPKNRKRFVSRPDPGGKKAVTHYQVTQQHDALSLVELKLETGRTHQIRVHLSTLGHPIVGDELYNGKKRANNLKNQKIKQFILSMNRFSLHAKELGFAHPTSKKELFFSVPPPENLKPIYDLCGFLSP